jgi:hypothetical protein
MIVSVCSLLGLSVRVLLSSCHGAEIGSSRVVATGDRPEAISQQTLRTIEGSQEAEESGQRLVLLGIPASQPLKQRTVEERITPIPDGYKCWPSRGGSPGCPYSALGSISETIRAVPFRHPSR